MSSFPILDLVLGMFFIYFLLSIISNSVIEVIMTYSHARSKILRQWLMVVFNHDKSLAMRIMNHPAVTALSKKDKTPDYISSRNFYTALVDLINKPEADKDKSQEAGSLGQLNFLEEKIKNTSVLHPDTQSMFLTFIAEARSKFAVLTKNDKNVITDTELFCQRVEDWYNSTQDRLTGAIKKRFAIPFTVITAIVITLCSNIDSIKIVKYLYLNPSSSAKIATEALKAVQDSSYQQAMNNPSDTALRNKAYRNASEAWDGINQQLPIGWNGEEIDQLLSFNCSSFCEIVMPHLAGWLLTIFAIMLGAPFWFDLMNKVANIRGSGIKPADKKTSEKKSND